MRDLYEILGVDKAATRDQIKKAYKELAQRWHPDRDGGDADKFAEISVAWEVLGDESKRARYDRCGETTEMNIEAKAESRLVMLFKHCIEQDWNQTDLMERCRIEVNRIRGELVQTRTRLEGLLKKTRKMRGRVTSKGDHNLFEPLLESKIAAIEGDIAEVKHGIEVEKMVLARLDDYRDSGEPFDPEDILKSLSFKVTASPSS